MRYDIKVGRDMYGGIPDMSILMMGVGTLGDKTICSLPMII